MKNRTKEILRICYFGTYSMDEGYPRNRVIIEGLRKNGVVVIECREDLWKNTSEKLEGVSAGYAKTILRVLLVYIKLIKKFIQVGQYHAIIVGYAGHIDIFLARMLNLLRRRPIIFDAFLSVYDTAVMDRKIVTAGSIKARLLHLLDQWACRMADVVLLDTEAHIDYFVKEFRLPRDKFRAVPVGSSLSIHKTTPIMANDIVRNGSDKALLGYEIASPSARNDGLVKSNFIVLYFGSYIPLHGVDVILKAARILQDADEKNIVFNLIGKGQLLAEMKRLASELELKNVIFIDRFVQEDELVQYIQEADICLGIFGQTDKAMRVVPCKVYNCMSMGKPLITADTEAVKGVLEHMKNAFLCKPDDPQSLADAVLSLQSDEPGRREIGDNSRTYFNDHFSVEAIGKKVERIAESLV